MGTSQSVWSVTTIALKPEDPLLKKGLGFCTSLELMFLLKNFSKSLECILNVKPKTAVSFLCLISENATYLYNVKPIATPQHEY